jgi:eukaryotic-like serine/threonine-protein kinase
VVPFVTVFIAVVIMPAPATTADLVDLIRKSQLLNDDSLDRFFRQHPATEPDTVVRQLQTDGLLTQFQAEQLMKGRHKGFILGKYRLLDRIGMGGMGQVYLAEHSSMKRRVALKVLPPDRGENSFARERFLREARAAAAIEHVNLVRAYDVEMEGSVAFLVMEYIDGVTLHDLVARRGAVEPGRTAHILWQIASGLQAIHERLLVHRDIKPANLLLDRAGVVRILDLGLVRSELDDDALTRGEGAKIVGTADYIAPEQAVNSSTVDGRADLYSLGCTAYYLLTQQPPFPGNKISQKLIAHQAYQPKPIRELNPAVPVELAQVIDKMLAKKPDERFQNAFAVQDALAPFVRASLPVEEDFLKADGSPGVGSNPKDSVSLGTPLASGSSGSAIRFASMGPTSGVSLASQPTATAEQEDTLPVRPQVHPKPAPMTPRPKPVEAPRYQIDLPPPIDRKPASPVLAVINSATVKANALFRNGQAPTVSPQASSRLWAVIGVIIVVAFVAAGALIAVKLR